MDGLKVYYDLLSQPSRAVWIFLKINQINFVDCYVNLINGEHLGEDFTKINPFQKVPFIEEDGFKLSESAVILEYLIRKYNVSRSWYPDDPQARARVDEYLLWHQADIRFPGVFYFRHKVLFPLMNGSAINMERLSAYHKRFGSGLDCLENVWLTNNKFLSGNEITISDLICITELEQPAICGFDLSENRPKLKMWLNEVKKKLQPHFDAAHQPLWKFKDNYKTDSKL